MKKLVSIITPVFNEESGLAAYHERLSKTLDEVEKHYDVEIVITDNCSTDRTFELLTELAEKDKRIRVFRFSRNYGYQKSIFTGYSKARGDCVLELDCDLQDPPELLPEFLKHWEEGYQIVYGTRVKRQESFLITLCRRIFYRLLSTVSENDLPLDAGDFMLLDRKVVDNLISIRDHNIYLRGEIFSFGFKRIGVSYAREERVSGSSKFPINKLVSLAVDGFVSQSTLPLRLASYFGWTLALGSIVLTLIYLGLKLFGLVSVPGFTTTTVLILLSVSINAVFLGIIGEYLARLYKNTSSKPFVIIDASIDRPEKNTDA